MFSRLSKVFNIYVIMLMISTCNGLNWLERKVHEAVGGDIPAVPRCCGRQRGRDNVPAQEPEEYFKRSVTIPFLDHLRNKLEQRFSSDQQRVVQGLSLIPAVMKENPKLEKTGCGIGNNDLPSEGNLDMEIVCWETKWAAESLNLPTDPQKTLLRYFFPTYIHF